MQEIPLRFLIRTLSFKRIANAALAIASFAVSASTRKPVCWGRPFILTVEPTNICNLRCPLCVTGNGKMTRQTGLMTFDTFKTLIDKTGDYLFYLLLYQQGEPFINKEFIRFVQYAKEKRIFVTTSTNAHYFDPETAQATVASGLDSIIVSIDGAEQETYAKYRVGGSLQQVLDGVRNLVNEKKHQHSKTPVIYIQFIVMQHNEHELARMKRLTRELGANRLLVKKVQVETVAEACAWLPQQESLKRYKIEQDALTPKKTGRGPCPRPWTSSLVNWDGTVVPCCFDKNAGHPAGSVADHEMFTQIWNSQAYDDFRAQMLADRSAIDICANCSQGLKLFA